MTTAEKILNNCAKGLITIVQDLYSKEYMSFSPYKDNDGDYRTSYWYNTIQKTKQGIGGSFGYSKEDLEEESKHWKIVEVYREEVEPFEIGNKVRILPSIEKIENWKNIKEHFPNMRPNIKVTIEEVCNSNIGLHYRVWNEDTDWYYIGHEHLAPLNEVKEETIKIGDHTYSKSEVEKRLQGLKEI